MGNLLREKVPIFDLASILEALADYGAATKDPDVLTEFVRQRLARTITSRYANEEGVLQAIAFAPQLEQTLMQNVVQEAVEPGLAQRIVKEVGEALRQVVSSGADAVLLTSSLVRRHVRNVLSSALPDLPVLSYQEVAPGVRIAALATVGAEKSKEAAAAS
jgi:flagellar biosynthesis protein FlhA